MADTQKARSWQEKVLDADNIWTQVKQALDSRGFELPTTPRRPDVRLIVENISGVDRVFMNPGKHSDKAEHIPADGDKKATMVMVKGHSLEQQHRNAEELVKRYGLDEKGLSDEFVNALANGEASDFVTEAYGPAPFEGQSSKLTTIDWEQGDGDMSHLEPVFSKNCALGARAATEETAFVAKVMMYVKGTDTTPELIEGAQEIIAVAEDWETGRETTRPISPIAAIREDYYGSHYDDLPVVEVHPDGFVQKIDLKNGTVIDFSAPADPKTAKPGL